MHISKRLTHVMLFKPSYNKKYLYVILNYLYYLYYKKILKGSFYLCNFHINVLTPSYNLGKQKVTINAYSGNFAPN